MSMQSRLFSGDPLSWIRNGAPDDVFAYCSGISRSAKLVGLAGTFFDLDLARAVFLKAWTLGSVQASLGVKLSAEAEIMFSVVS